MLYSTKRKWEKIISNVSAPLPPAKAAPSSTSTVQAPPTEPPSDPKKRRIVDLPNDSRPSVRAVSPSGPIRSTYTTASTFRPESRASPSYAPWDRNAFLERLGTFRFVDKWLAKPAAVNEVQWAKRGWVCCDKNRVRCQACRKEVLVKVDTDDERSETGKAVIKQYEAMIVNEHEDNCLWKKRGCDDTIYKLPLANGTVARPAFTKRYASLAKIRDGIPPSLSYPDAVEPAALHYPSECTNDGPVFEAAAVLALFGWQNEDPGIPDLVSCSACFRRLGLWLFRKRVVDGQESEPTEASVCRLDVVEEHRDYCPWVNGASQGKEPGWQTMLRVLQHAPKGSSAVSVYSIASIAPTEATDLTDADRNAEDDKKLKKLKRLKSLYFGKRKKSIKEADKGKPTGKENGNTKS